MRPIGLEESPQTFRRKPESGICHALRMGTPANEGCEPRPPGLGKAEHGFRDDEAFPGGFKQLCQDRFFIRMKLKKTDLANYDLGRRKTVPP
jgi:hypothetical protein